LAPADPVSVAVALADKIDLLVGFWWMNEKPTGSKDPYALRRAALVLIRIILENNIRIRLRPIFLEELCRRDVGPQLRRVVAADLLDFVLDRLKVQLREQGAPPEIVGLFKGQDDVLLIARRVEAIVQFLATDD